MQNIENELLKETNKMLAKLENEMQHIQFDKSNKALREEIENIKAYISDCRHFLDKSDLVKAFEAIVFAWGIFEALSNMHLIKTIGHED